MTATPPRLGELDRVAGEIEQHLAQPRRVADHARGKPLVDVRGDLEALRLRARREQLDRLLDQRARARTAASRGRACRLRSWRSRGFPRSATAACRRRSCTALRIGRLLGAQRRVEQQVGHAEDAVERRADLVADHREEAALGAVGGLGLVARLGRAPARPAARSVTSRPTLCISPRPELASRIATSRQAIQRAPSASIFWSWMRVPSGSARSAPCSSTASAKLRCRPAPRAARPARRRTRRWHR